jgi:hypothetical protein
VPNWRELYDVATIETNPQFQLKRLDEAEAAIWMRLRELDKSSDGHVERHEIEVAAVTILAMRTEKLGWPDPFKPIGKSA